MPKLTVRVAVRECIRQWRWIIDQLDNGSTVPITLLKKRWCREHNLNWAANCAFCEYKTRQIGWCSSDCPGCLCQSDFRCFKVRTHYRTQPHEFYKLLLSLDVSNVKKGI